MSKIGGSKVLNGQSREIVHNVFQYFISRKSEDETRENIKEKVAEATKVSKSSIGRILREARISSSENNGAFIFATPHEKRPRRRNITGLPDYELCDFRSIIHNFHHTENQRVTLKSLQEKLKNDLNWNGSTTSLYRVIRKLKFRFKKTQKRKILVENSDLRALRIQYLKKIKQFRSEQRPIVFIDETYIHSGHTKSKSWSDDSLNGLFCNISKGPRMIIIHAGGDMGFIPNALLMFKSGTKSGDYHDEMNSKNYEKWLTEMLIPNLPQESVVVIDNAPYHSVQLNPAPNSNTKKATMIDWLRKKNISFHDGMLKPELYTIIKQHKDKHRTYKFDVLMQQHGHTVLRLPPYHPDLNPIELVWASVKNAVARRNVSFKFEDVESLAREEFSKISQEEWRKRCEHVVKVEDNYLSNEIIIDIHTEELIINLGDSSDSDSDESDSVSSESADL